MSSSATSSSATSAAKATANGHGPTEDLLRRFFAAATQQDRDDCLHATTMAVDCIKTSFPTMFREAQTGFDLAVASRDADYLHFIWLVSIPAMDQFVQSLGCAKFDPLSYQRFIERLLFDRNNFMDGLTSSGTDCKQSSGVQYNSIRQFVGAMRHEYLARSNMPKTDPVIVAADEKRLARWSRPDFVMKPDEADVGTLWFQIVGIRLLVEIKQQMSLKPGPSWGDETSPVQCVLVSDGKKEEGKDEGKDASKAADVLGPGLGMRVIIRHSLKPVRNSRVDPMRVKLVRGQNASSSSSSSSTRRTTTGMDLSDTPTALNGLSPQLVEKNVAFFD